MAGKRGQRQFGYVRKLPSGRWQASYLGPDGQRRAADVTFSEKADASAWLATIQTDLIRGDWRPPEPAREAFGPFAEAWLELGVGRKGEPLSPTTVELYEGLWRRWLAPTFAGVAMGDITLEQVRTWLAKARKDNPKCTQPDKAYRLLRCILNVAIDDEKIRVNPCRIAGAGKESAPERPVASTEQVLAIADSIEPRYRALVILAAFCALRFGELAGLRRSRVDLLHREVYVVEQLVELSGGKTEFKTPKSDSDGTVPIPLRVVPIIEDHLAEYVGSDPAALLFTSPQGHPLRRTKFRPRWAEACRKAGVTGLHFHDLRGTAATRAGEQGASFAEIMALLRHKTPGAALRYQHSTAERRRMIADSMGDLMDGAQEPSAQVRPLHG
jgi:integrase